MSGFSKFIAVLIMGDVGLNLTGVQFHWGATTVLGVYLVYASIIIAMGKFD